MRVALYVRVSGLNQVQAQTPEQQLSKLQAEVEARKLKLAPEHIYRDDGYSGAKLNRPGLERLRDAVACHEVDLILITAPDRLARKYVHQVLLIEEFEKSGCLIEFIEHPMSQDPHDQLLLQIRGAVAEYERSLIAERMRRGRLTRLKAGSLLPYTRMPFGYRSDPQHPRDPAGMRIEESEAMIVKLIFAYYVEPKATLHSLVQTLASMGIPTPKGNQVWNPSSLRQILCNPVYAGMAYGNRYECPPAKRRKSAVDPLGKAGLGTRLRPPEEWIGIAVPAIIEQETFDQVQAKLDHNRQIAKRNNRKNFYLLRCLVSCGRCGLACTGRRLSELGYYVCSGKMDTLRAMRTGRRCDTRYIPMDSLEEAVWTDVCAVLTQPDLVRLALERVHGGHWLPQDLQARQVNLRRASKQIENQQVRLLEAYLADVIGLAEFERVRAELARKQEQLLVQQRHLEASAEQQKELAHLAASLEEFCASVRDGLRQATSEQKRQLVELLIDRVIVEDERVEIRYAMPTSRDGPKIPFCRLRLNYFVLEGSVEPFKDAHASFLVNLAPDPTANVIAVVLEQLRGKVAAAIALDDKRLVNAKLTQAAKSLSKHLTSTML